MKVLILRVALLTTILIASSLADARENSWNVFGHGNSSCGEWVQPKDVSRETNMAWVLGFLSGAQFGAAAVFETDAAAVEVYMTNYCQAHPLEKIVEGAKALANDLDSRSK
jgi:hypothetical protein